jgi:hypothetical protein
MDADRINPFAAHGLRIYRYIIAAGAELDAVRSLEEGHGDDKVVSDAMPAVSMKEHAIRRWNTSRT